MNFAFGRLFFISVLLWNLCAVRALAGNEISDEQRNYYVGEVLDYYLRPSGIEVSRPRTERAKFLVSEIRKANNENDLISVLFAHYSSIKNPYSELSKRIESCLIKLLGIKERERKNAFKQAGAKQVLFP